MANHTILPKVPKKYAILFAAAAIIIIIAVMIFSASQVVDGILGLRQPVFFTCTDSDNGTVTDTFGECEDNSRQTYSDTCVLTGIRTPLKLREWHCSEFCEQEIVECPLGSVCAGGKCVQG